METIKATNDGTDVYFGCPNEACDMWQSLGIDEKRSLFDGMPITEWEPDEEGKNEVSHHRCRQCETEFKVEWDYSNVEEPDEDE